MKLSTSISRARVLQDIDIASLLATSTLELLDTAISFGHPLMEAGLDSLLGAQFVKLISTSLSADFSPTLIFDHPTLGAVAKAIGLPACVSFEVGIALDSGRCFGRLDECFTAGFRFQLPGHVESFS